MEYKLLKQDEQDEHIASFLLAQERDHFLHQLNKNRYEDMLADMPASAFRDRIEQLLNETISRITEVEAIVASTNKVLPSDDRLDQAIIRVDAKAEVTKSNKAK